MRVVDLVNFIKARERHRVAHDKGGKVVRPDPIIAQYRFCNVRRNDDRVTQWIFRHYLEPWEGKDELWFALVVARLFNQPDTLAAIDPYVLPFKSEKIRAVLHKRRDAGVKNFNAAYIVSTNGRAMDKVDYVIDHILTPMWQNRKALTKLLRQSKLANAHIALMAYQGMGSFMAAQVLADLKYAVHWNSVWDDFDTFAASGPGSRRGLSRVMTGHANDKWNEGAFRSVLSQLRDAVNLRLKLEEPLTAQDIQNCLCEFDKYERARLGEGTPKQNYTPSDLPWET